MYANLSIDVFLKRTVKYGSNVKDLLILLLFYHQNRFEATKKWDLSNRRKFVKIRFDGYFY
jgi:hypothetical protein